MDFNAIVTGTKTLLCHSEEDDDNANSYSTVDQAKQAWYQILQQHDCGPICDLRQQSPAFDDLCTALESVIHALKRNKKQPMVVFFDGCSGFRVMWTDPALFRRVPSTVQSSTSSVASSAVPSSITTTQASPYALASAPATGVSPSAQENDYSTKFIQQVLPDYFHRFGGGPDVWTRAQPHVQTQVYSQNWLRPNTTIIHTNTKMFAHHIDTTAAQCKEKEWDLGALGDKEEQDEDLIAALAAFENIVSKTNPNQMHVL